MKKQAGWAIALLWLAASGAAIAQHDGGAGEHGSGGGEHGAGGGHEVSAHEAANQEAGSHDHEAHGPEHNDHEHEGALGNLDHDHWGDAHGAGPDPKGGKASGGEGGKKK
jgi:hypothetical protein